MPGTPDLAITDHKAGTPQRRHNTLPPDRTLAMFIQAIIIDPLSGARGARHGQKGSACPGRPTYNRQRWPPEKMSLAGMWQTNLAPRTCERPVRGGYDASWKSPAERIYRSPEDEADFARETNQPSTAEQARGSLQAEVWRSSRLAPDRHV